MGAMSKASKFVYPNRYRELVSLDSNLDSNFDSVPKRSLMRNGEKMYSEFEWRTFMDKTVRI